jgi:CRISPR-associated exonuclease Cas4
MCGRGSEDEPHVVLNLSGIQKYAFCPRQWALMTLEDRWEDNLHTVLGSQFHENAHAGIRAEERGKTLTVRRLSVCSRELGIAGVCDVVEFVEDPKGVSIFGRDGRFNPVPVEYKKGKGLFKEADSLQLCAQGLCLEEMLCCRIDEAFVYYGEPKRRAAVALDDVLRQKVLACIKGMRAILASKSIPKPAKKRGCGGCSLAAVCLPELQDKSAEYILSHIGEAGDA